MLSPALRPLNLTDEQVIWTMLMHAAHEPSLEIVRTNPLLVPYAEQWGRGGDLGYGAFIEEQAVGAAWVRLWSGEIKGFGYLDRTIPELAIAVIPAHQGKGIGTHLLQQVLCAAKGLYPAISLNVRADNPAVSLYQRLGFMPVQGSEQVNRVGGISFNMIHSLEDSWTGDRPHP